MFKKLLLASLVVAPTVSTAGGLSYNYLEASYSRVGLALYSERSKGSRVNLGGSLVVAPKLLISGDYSMLSAASIDDVNVGNVGVGYPYAVNPEADVVFGADLVFADVGAEDDAGYRLRTHLRMDMDIVELSLGGSLTKIFDSEIVLLSAGAGYNFTDHIAAIVGVEYDSEDTFALKLGVRLNL